MVDGNGDINALLRKKRTMGGEGRRDELDWAFFHFPMHHVVKLQRGRVLVCEVHSYFDNLGLVWHAQRAFALGPCCACVCDGCRI